MTTNYYWHDEAAACPNPCAHCRHDPRIHVGHSAGGWSFLFRGWPADSSPFGFPVMSRADWRKVFIDRPGKLWDEYRREITGPLHWLDGLEVPDELQQAKELGWLGGWRAEEHIRRDAEGFRIETREFS